MKIAAQRGFWPLGPTLTAHSLEFGCWVAAAFLAVLLAISPTPAVRPAQGLWQQCVDRVLASDLGDTEEYFVRQINQQCSTRRRTAARPVGLTCGRPLVMRLTPVARRVAGCPAG